MKIDLPPQVIDFMSSTGHVARPEGITHLCANSCWYRYARNNEWEIVAPQDLPKELKDSYLAYLKDLIKLIEGEK